MEDLLLVVVILTALFFDFTNGFHDTANAVATSVSTRSLTPRQAVAVAALANLAGAFVTTAVAKTVGQGIIDTGIASQQLILAALLGAISWNLFTWYLGLPSSSSHALFGGLKKFRADYSVIPWATFTDPEVARVGLNETEAREKGIAHEVTTYGLDDLDRAIADEEAHGLVKVLTAPGSDRILGATIAGANAGELIAEFVAAMRHGIGLNKILGTIHVYPTLAEANKYAAGAWKRAHAPQRLLAWLERFHAWMRR